MYVRKHAHIHTYNLLKRALWIFFPLEVVTIQMKFAFTFEQCKEIANRDHIALPSLLRTD